MTSPPDQDYNCIAWAAGMTDAWWWPVGTHPKRYWPPGVPRALTLAAFCDALATVGYAACQGEALEPGFEKAVLFADVQGTPAHAARQLLTGRWASKCGFAEDIEHDLRDVEGQIYGTVAVFMKRPLAPAAAVATAPSVP
ncbi:MAG TPA: hypothetical protein VFW33_04585 [Gemmataceae bacterium]|nr:hypothetical protein [Gemmataceae bacterium]